MAGNLDCEAVKWCPKGFGKTVVKHSTSIFCCHLGSSDSLISASPEGWNIVVTQNSREREREVCETAIKVIILITQSGEITPGVKITTSNAHLHLPPSPFEDVVSHGRRGWHAMFISANHLSYNERNRWTKQPQGCVKLMRIFKPQWKVCLVWENTEPRATNYLRSHPSSPQLTSSLSCSLEPSTIVIIDKRALHPPFCIDSV